MLKRSVAEQQVVKTNRTDFDKAGGGKKVGYNFEIEINLGKAQNRSTSLIAKDLVTVLLQVEAAMATLRMHSFTFSMNPKCELKITCTSSKPVEVEEESSL